MPEKNGRKVQVLGLAAVLAVAAALRLWLVPAQLPFHYYADEYQVVERALRVGTGQLNPGLFTWPGTLVIYLDFALYVVYFALQVAAGTVGSAAELARLYWTDPTAFYLLARALSASFGLLAVGAVYYVTASVFLHQAGGLPKEYARVAGILAAATFALAPQAIISSAQALPDMAATALALVAVGVVLRTHGAKKIYGPLTAGLFLGLAASAKYHAALYLVPVLALTVPRERGFTGATARASTVVAGLAAGFVLACPFAVLDFGTFARDVTAMLGRPGMAAFKSDPIYLITTTLPLGLSWPIFVIGAAGTLWCLARRPKGAGLVLILAIIPYAAVALVRPLPPRHLLPLYPAAAAAGGVFISELIYVTRKRFGAGFGVVPTFTAVVVLLLVCLEDVKLVAFERREDSRTAALEFIEDTIPPATVVLTETVEPDVLSPPLWPDRESLRRIGKYRREKGLGAGGRVEKLLKDPAYPFNKKVYTVYLVEAHADLDGVKAAYAVRSLLDDVRFFAEQGKLPGTPLNEWDVRYARYLRERGRLVATFSGTGRPGPTVEIYKIKR